MKGAFAGRYILEKRIGEGGMGEVWRGRDVLQNNRAVAVKILKGAFFAGAGAESFKSEFRRLAALSHPNIAKVFDFGRAEGRFFFTSELIRGDNLFAASRRMDAASLLAVFARTLAALQYVHSRGIVHRDVKPSNILVAAPEFPGGRFGVKLIDFGIAVRGKRPAGEPAAGTLAYMAPEILRGEGANPSTDLYSFGLVMYQVYARRLPAFTVDSALRGRRLSLEPLERSAAPEPVRQIIRKLLEPEPARRFVGAAEAIAELEKAERATGGTAQTSVSSVPPFTGRERELAELKIAYHARVRTVPPLASPAVVIVKGEAGAGKTRLIEELKITAQLDETPVFVGENSKAGRGPYGAAAAILRGLVLHLGERHELAREYRGLLDAMFPESGRGVLENAPTDRTALVDGLCEMLVRASAALPMAVVFENMEEAPDGAWIFLEHLVRAASLGRFHSGKKAGDAAAAQSRILILAALRTGEELAEKASGILKALQSADGACVITLGKLGRGDSDRLAGAALGSRNVPKKLLDAVAEEAGGNPLFIVEVLKNHEDDGVLRHTSGGWIFRPRRTHARKIPGNIGALFMRRMARLGRREREILEAVSAFNVPVNVEILAAVARADGQKTAEYVDSLVGRMLLATAPGGDISFSQAIFKRAAYESLSAKRRRTIHAAAAAELEKMHLEGRFEGVEELAGHFIGAGDARGALKYGTAAARHCSAIFANERAMALYRAVLALVSRMPERGGVLRELAVVEHRVGEYAGALGHYEEALEAGGKRAAAEQAEILIETGRIFEDMGRLDGAAERYAAAFKRLSGPKTALHASALNRTAWVEMSRGDADAALETAFEGLEIVKNRECEERASLLNTIGAAYRRKGATVESNRYFLDALDASQRIGDARGIASCLNNLGLVAWSRGNMRLAEKYFEKSLLLKVKMGDVRGRAAGLNNLGGVYEKTGDLAKALACHRAALRIRERIGDRAGTAASCRNMGNIHLALNRYSAARDAFEQAAALDSESGQKDMEAAALARLAETRIKLGLYGPAEQSARNALSAAEKSGDKAVLIEAGLSLASAALKKGKPRETLDILGRKEIQSAADRAAARREILASNAHLALSEHGEAVCRAEEAQRRAADCGSAELSAEALLALGEARIKSGREDEGRRAFEDAALLSDGAGAREVLWRVARALAALARKDGGLAAANSHYRRVESVLLDISEGLETGDRAAYLAAEGRAEALKEAAEFGRVFREERTALKMIGLREDHFLKLLEINRDLARATGKRTLVPKILKYAAVLTGAERAFLIVEEKDGLAARLGVTGDGENVRLADAKFSRSVALEAIRSGRPVVSADAPADALFSDAQSVRDLKVKSVLAVPMESASQRGVIYVENRFQKGAFSERDIWLLGALATQAEMALGAERLVRGEEVLKGGKTSEERESAPDSMDEAEEFHAIPAVEPDAVDAGPLIGKSPAMYDAVRIIRRLAPSDAPVLITGESGTGKELAARMLHDLSSRRGKPFVSVNCAAFSEGLLEAELFGHEKGAFTGASEPHAGLIKSADGGTLFLDEVGEMSPAMQKKLLRFLETGEFRPVGGRSLAKVNVRILSATNRDIRRMAGGGEFRSDLLYRLDVVSVDLPALRTHPEDIPQLISAYAGRRKPGIPALKFTKGAMKLLMEYPWPGNVRELENEIERLLAVGVETVRVSSLSGRICNRENWSADAAASVVNIKEAVRLAEVREIKKSLEASDGNKSRAAKMLGIGRKSLFRRMKKHGLLKPGEKEGD
jgi:transcriptional regulator with GAF, ATPase, and Fis domain/predicted ATPase